MKCEARRVVAAPFEPYWPTAAMMMMMALMVVVVGGVDSKSKSIDDVVWNLSSSIHPSTAPRRRGRAVDEAERLRLPSH